jgi:hypothetical protein
VEWLALIAAFEVAKLLLAIFLILWGLRALAKMLSNAS